MICMVPQYGQIMISLFGKPGKTCKTASFQISASIQSNLIKVEHNSELSANERLRAKL